MCGIVGVLQTNGEPVNRDVVCNMRDELAHRGPDDRGIFIDGPVGLGQRRLSILDLSSAGHQPMSTADGRFTIVFNGEIYNFRELARAYLTEETLTSQSDTEVLLHLLALKGTAVLPELKGMFAFACWDHERKELLLANDPFGKKPLYYEATAEAFRFASEPKSLLRHRRAVLQENVIAQYLLHEYIPSPNTGFEGIRKLEMGHVLTVSNTGVVNIRPWWNPRFRPVAVQSEKAVLDTLDELLGRAVERRLVADVPVGIFLSGGLDSTTILWYMRQMRKEPIESCSIQFAEKSFDESTFIALAAASLGTNHHAAMFGVRDVPAVLDEVCEFMDVPLADASLLPTYAVSKLARRHMKVVLSGDGADELFGGYGTFKAGELAARLDRFVPTSVWPVVQKMTDWLPVSHDYFSFDFKAKSFVRGMTYGAARRNQIWLGSFSDVELKELLINDSSHHAFAAVDEAARTQPPGSFELLSGMTVAHYLQDDILVKLDRSTMMVGLEARTPFLDVDVAEFVMQLPRYMRRDKYILKKLMRGRIPGSIIDRPKKGFGIPLGLWLAGPLAEWMTGELQRERIEQQGLFSWPYIRRLLDEHAHGKADHRKKIWTLIVWQRWYARWILAA